MYTLEETLINYPAYDLSGLDLSTLLTTMEENLHVISNFKSETFSLLRYAFDSRLLLKSLLSKLPNILLSIILTRHHIRYLKNQ